MTVKQLAKHLEYIDEKYLQDALKALEATDKRRRPKVSRVLPIAAIIAALLALSVTALAANWFGLRDILLPQPIEVIPSIGDEHPNRTPYMANAVTLSGYAYTAESLATAEWMAYVADCELKDPGYIPAAPYIHYQVYDKSMENELDRIAERYGLKLHNNVMFLDYEALCTQVGGSFAGNSTGGGYIYDDGTFHYEGRAVLPDYGKLDYQLERCVRGSLTDVCLNIGDPDMWQEWHYTTSGGMELALALSDKRGLILAELPESFVTINVLAGTQTDESDIFSSGAVGAAELEALAECVDFSLLTPVQCVDMSAKKPDIPIERIYADRNTAYRYAMETLMKHSLLPDGGLYEPFDSRPGKFAIVDVNGDGEEELLLCCDNTYSAGMVTYVLGFDEQTGCLRVMLAEYPALRFYSGGLVKAEASHNHGKAGDLLWPYTLYQYDAAAGEYTAVAMVDAWDKSLGEVYMDDQFPDHADTSGSGAVYYVMKPDRYSFEKPMDVSEYKAWYDEMLGTAEAADIYWQLLNEENTAQIK